MNSRSCIGAGPRTIGLHFFNPPPVMELLEIVRSLDTSEATQLAQVPARQLALVMQPADGGH